MAERETALESLAQAIKQLRKLDRQLARNGFRAYSEPLRAALAELESARQLLASAPSKDACARCGKDPAEGWATINGQRYCHGEERPSCYERALWEQAGTSSLAAPASGEEEGRG